MKFDIKAGKRFFNLAMMMLVSMFAAQLAIAGGGGSEIQSIYQQVADWTQGYLGKLLTLLFIVVGLVAGVVRQSLLAFAVGIGAGIGVYNAPILVNALVGATI